MEELEVLKKMRTVAAPPDFERSILLRLALAKEQKVRAKRTFRMAFVGAAAAVLATFLALNTGLFRKTGSMIMTDKLGDAASPAKGSTYEKSAVPGSKSDIWTAADMIPVMETLDYSREVRGLQTRSKRTVYILEQVSEASLSEISY